MHFSKLLIPFLFLLTPLALWADVTSLSGTVVDAETGETLPTVQVYFTHGGKPTTVGTTTDFDGHFILSNEQDYTTVCLMMLGYKTETLQLKKGTSKTGMIIRLTPESFDIQEIVVKPKKEKTRYKRKGNPAVELIKNVIAHKDHNSAKSAPQYTADTYKRMSFAIENFHPNFQKGFWKNFAFAEKYIDTTEEYEALTVSIRENLQNEYFQHKPRKEKSIIRKKRVFGLEDQLGGVVMQSTLNAVFCDVDINDDNMALLFNRFVSPLSAPLAVSYYQYYIQDTILLDGDSCIDLTFVPVNSQSYSFTGHLYIVNDSTYALKRYKMSVPKDINLNFVKDFQVEQSFRQGDNGLWLPDRTQWVVRFGIMRDKYMLRARQTKLYTAWDFDSPIDPELFSAMTADDLSEEAQPTPVMPADDDASQAAGAIVKAADKAAGKAINEQAESGVAKDEKPLDDDQQAVRLSSEYWETLRPEPLTFYETSVYDMVQEFLANKTFNSIAVTVSGLGSQFFPTTDANHMDESKFDIGPIYDFLSWNVLEGVRLRFGGMTTANVNKQWFFYWYTAFGTKDLMPKFNCTLIHTFDKKKYLPYEHKLNHIALSVQHEVEEPGQLIGVIDRDNILMSIPTSKPVMKNYQYVSHVKLEYLREWQNKLTLRASMDFQHNRPAGALHYDRVVDYHADGKIGLTQNVRSFNCYEAMAELRYAPGAFAPIDRMGQESTFTLDQDAPLLRLTHYIGFLDDRYTGGTGFFYNRTELSAEKRFWFSAFGHLDARLQGGIVWNQVPFVKLHIPQASTSIFLAQNAFNQMQPMEFMMDKYVALFATYYFKGWVINRIPGLNKLKLRGVVSFSGLYGGLSDKNNPYLAAGKNTYQFPNSAVYDGEGHYVSGYTSSPIDYRMPYMEITAGIENIFRFIRIDYVRRLTYNDYLLPDGHRRTIGAWGRNGVKISVRFAL